MVSARSRSFLAGVLAGNSLPHFASAVTARRHLTPIAGRDSGTAVNGVWAGLNLAGACLLLRSTSSSGERRWTADLLAFEAGVVTLAAWMLGSEAWLRTNSRV
jgi:hypothetical protein